MQSWGIQSRFYERDTCKEPTKSGIIGMICAALGRKRENDISDLTKMKIGIRVEREGVLSRDFHAVGCGKFNDKDYGIVKSSGKSDSKNKGTIVSNRYYLSDAEFYVAISLEEDLLNEIHEAIHDPFYQIFLGKKSFVPEMPMCYGIKEGKIEDVLRNIKFRQRKDEDVPESIRYVFECGIDEGMKRLDDPISFSTRKYLPRYIKYEYFPISNNEEEIIPCMFQD
jgi:CRISPR system Cascade subunit CasD